MNQYWTADEIRMMTDQQFNQLRIEAYERQIEWMRNNSTAVSINSISGFERQLKCLLETRITKLC